MTRGDAININVLLYNQPWSCQGVGHSHVRPVQLPPQRAGLLRLAATTVALSWVCPFTCVCVCVCVVGGGGVLSMCQEQQGLFCWGTHPGARCAIGSRAPPSLLGPVFLCLSPESLSSIEMLEMTLTRDKL